MPTYLSNILLATLFGGVAGYNCNFSSFQVTITIWIIFIGLTANAILERVEEIE